MSTVWRKQNKKIDTQHQRQRVTGRRTRRLVVCLLLAVSVCQLGADDRLLGGERTAANGGIFAAPTTTRQTSAFRLTANDVRIDESIEGGFVLSVRAGSGVQSVLITESTRNAQNDGPVYSLTTNRYNSINGDERRILDGEFLQTSEGGRYYLVDSTPEDDEQWGARGRFRIFIPYVVEYGFPATRSGQINVGNGTFINVRAFAAPFGDYRGGFTDNPFLIRVEQLEVIAEKQGKVLQQSAEDLSAIAAVNSGVSRVAADGIEAAEQIGSLLDQKIHDALDLVLVIDTTRSMRNDIAEINDTLPRLVRSYLSEDGTEGRVRIGLVLYRDYGEEYIATDAVLISDFNDFQRRLQAIVVDGGGDEPEAVFESLYVALHSFPWRAPQREIVLIGDAPPHSLPRGEVTSEIVFADAQRLAVNINTIILPR